MSLQHNDCQGDELAAQRLGERVLVPQRERVDDAHLVREELQRIAQGVIRGSKEVLTASQDAGRARFTFQAVAHEETRLVVCHPELRGLAITVCLRWKVGGRVTAATSEAKEAHDGMLQPDVGYTPHNRHQCRSPPRHEGQPEHCCKWGEH